MIVLISLEELFKIAIATVIGVIVLRRLDSEIPKSWEIVILIIFVLLIVVPVFVVDH